MNLYFVCRWLRNLSNEALTWLLNACPCGHNVESFLMLMVHFTEGMADEETSAIYGGDNPLLGFRAMLANILEHIRKTDVPTVYEFKMHVLYVYAWREEVRQDDTNSRMLQAIQGGLWIVVIAFISCGFTLSQEAFENHSGVGMQAHTKRMNKLPDTQDAARLRVSMQDVLSRIRHLNVLIATANVSITDQVDKQVVARHTMDDACALLKSMRQLEPRPIPQ